MAMAMTTLSRNGQVVIPAAVRKEAGLKQSTKFLVLNKGGNILLKKMDEEELDAELIASIKRGEEDIKAGRYTEVKPGMSVEEIDEMIMNEDLPDD